MKADGYTVSELAAILGVEPHTIQVRINRKGIKPLTREAIYPPDTLDRIREAPMGRPKKPKDNP